MEYSAPASEAALSAAIDALKKNGFGVVVAEDGDEAKRVVLGMIPEGSQVLTMSSETLRIRIQREIYEMTAGRPGGQIRILLHPQLSDVFRSQQAVIEKNVQRSVKIQSDRLLKWEDYRIVLE